MNLCGAKNQLSMTVRVSMSRRQKPLEITYSQMIIEINNSYLFTFNEELSFFTKIIFAFSLGRENVCLPSLFAMLPEEIAYNWFTWLCPNHLSDLKKLPMVFANYLGHVTHSLVEKCKGQLNKDTKQHKWSHTSWRSA